MFGASVVSRIVNCGILCNGHEQVPNVFREQIALGGDQSFSQVV
jgi:hypothetical protein